MENQSKPKSAAYTLILPKDRKSGEKFEIHLKEMDEVVFTAAQNLTLSGKQTEAVKLVIRELYVGGSPIDEVLSSWQSVRAAMSAVTELLEPLDYELKKN